MRVLDETRDALCYCSAVAKASQLIKLHHHGDHQQICMHRQVSELLGIRYPDERRYPRCAVVQLTEEKTSKSSKLHHASLSVAAGIAGHRNA
jgi:hypothetical protein